MKGLFNFANMIGQSPDGLLHAYAQVPVPIQMQVAAPSIPSNADNQLINMMGGRQGDLYVDELYGRHYHQTYRGKVYHATTAAAGVLIPVQSATTIQGVLWNPAGNAYNLVMIAAYYGWVSTTGAPSNIGYSFQTGVGSAVATGAPIITFTNVAPRAGLLGGQSSTAFWAPATCTITSASTYLGTNGMSQLTTTGATTSAPFFSLVDIFDGTIIIPPGCIFHPTSANTAELSVMDIRFVWAEVPI